MSNIAYFETQPRIVLVMNHDNAVTIHKGDYIEI